MQAELEWVAIVAHNPDRHHFPPLRPHLDIKAYLCQSSANARCAAATDVEIVELCLNSCQLLLLVKADVAIGIVVD